MSKIWRGCIVFIAILSGCAAPAPTWDNLNDEGTFLMYRRQSLIGEESFSIVSDRDSLVVRSLQGENERGRISGVEAVLRLVG